MPITAQQAWDATDPAQSQEERETAAQQIMMGVAANDAYLDSRSELDRLKALSQGGQVVSHQSINEESGQVSGPTGPDVQTVEGTAVEEESPTIGQGSQSDESTAPTDGTTEDRLRKQLTDAGLTPEA